MKGNQFKDNYAYNDTNARQGIGAGFYFSCSSEYNCEMNLTDTNVFQLNFAENAGGGLAWLDVKPSIEDSNKFKKNMASLYGDDIASFAQKIVQINSTYYDTLTEKIRNPSSREDMYKQYAEENDTSLDSSNNMKGGRTL